MEFNNQHIPVHAEKVHPCCDRLPYESRSLYPKLGSLNRALGCNACRRLLQVRVAILQTQEAEVELDRATG